MRVEARLKGINSFAPIQRSTRSAVSVDSVLGIKGFDLKRVVEMDPNFLDTEGEHEHDKTVSSLAIAQPGEVHLELVNEWVGSLLREHGADIYRMKGILAIAHANEKFVFQVSVRLRRADATRVKAGACAMDMLVTDVGPHISIMMFPPSHMFAGGPHDLQRRVCRAVG